MGELPKHGGHVIQDSWSGKGTHYLNSSALTSGAYGWNVEAGNEARPVRNYVGNSDKHNIVQAYKSVNIFRRIS